MAVDLPKRTYSGAIRSIELAGGDKTGGATAFPFYTFEGEMPNKPRFGLDILDIEPEGWADSLAKQYSDVWGDPAAWAKKCVDTFGAEVIQLTLEGINPNDKDLPLDHAMQVVDKVVAAVNVPLAIWGCGNAEKDAEVLKAVAEKHAGRRLLIGPVVEENHKQLGAAALAYKHVAISSAPCDINLSKQLNVLLGNLGVPDDSIVIDPTSAGLGYGLEYTYSIMERARMAALTQQDDRLQFPVYCNIGTEVWKTKEAKLPDDEMNLGNAEKRGVLMEAITATTMLAAGGDMLIMRHPEALRLARTMTEELLAD